MGVFRTSKGRVVRHCHITNPPPCPGHAVTQDEIDGSRDWMHRNFPHAIEVRPPTWDYSCIGFALARSHGWFEATNVLLTDDFFQVDMDQPQVGDVVIYFNFDIWKVAHAAVITQVEDGEIVEVQSKWGANAECRHRLTECPEVYGTPIKVVRRNP